MSAFGARADILFPHIWSVGTAYNNAVLMESRGAVGGVPVVAGPRHPSNVVTVPNGPEIALIGIRNNVTDD